MALEQLKQHVSEELAYLDSFIKQQLHSDVPLINAICTHLMAQGGKRIRPLVVILSAKAAGLEDSEKDAITTLASIVEFIHAATLLHDDVIDQSSLRRNHQTAHTIWGNEASVLVGDFLYALAFQLIASLNDPHILSILAKATRIIVEGELRQLQLRDDAVTTEDMYYQVISAKTAKLFEVAAQLGPVQTKQPHWEQNFADFGNHIGIAYQLVDDALDYDGESQGMGKNCGDDWAEGKLTLPLIYALGRSSPSQKAFLLQALDQHQVDSFEPVADLISQLGGITYTLSRAEHHITMAREALAPVPDSLYKQTLLDLALFILKRRY